MLTICFVRRMSPPWWEGDRKVTHGKYRHSINSTTRNIFKHFRMLLPKWIGMYATFPFDSIFSLVINVATSFTQCPTNQSLPDCCCSIWSFKSSYPTTCCWSWPWGVTKQLIYFPLLFLKFNNDNMVIAPMQVIVVTDFVCL